MNKSLKIIKTEENAEKRSQDMFSAVGLLIIGGGCLVLFVVILFFVGCRENMRGNSNVQEEVLFMEDYKAATIEESVPEEKTENMENDATDFFIVEHKPLPCYQLIDTKVIDSVSILALEYYNLYKKMPSQVEDLYDSEFQQKAKSYLEDCANLQYVMEWKKESDKKSSITIGFADKIYNVIYEWNGAHFFSVYCNGELEKTICRANEHSEPVHVFDRQ